MRLNLKFKLLILIALTILITLFVNSYLHYNNMVEEYRQNAFNSTNSDYKSIEYKLNKYKQNLKNLSNQIVNDSNVQSITNLISNYEDKNNYNKIIFDEEKKRLLNLISQQIKLKDNISFAVFDKDGEPIVINRQRDGKVISGIVSYNKKAEFININTNKITKVPWFMKMKNNSEKVDIRIDKNGFGLVCLQKIYQNNEFVGYFRIKEIFTKSSVDLFIDNLNNKFSFLTEDFLMGNFYDINKEFIKTHSKK